MKKLKALIKIIIFSLSCHLFASDIDHPVAGAEVEDLLGAMEKVEGSSYLVEGASENHLEDEKFLSSNKNTDQDFIFKSNLEEVSINSDPRREFKDFGYNVPGSVERQDSYGEIDKAKMAKGFRKVSEGAFNLSFIKNDFSYTSTNDVINRTIGNGPKGKSGGFLIVRNDSYIARSFLLNTYWSLGGGVGYSSGNGIFIDNSVSDAVFKFWQFPLDLGIGLEIPLYTWFKIAGTAGGSGLVLMQNRSDFESNEKGKRKYQFSPGYFASAQFKINLTGFGSDAAYDAFTSSQITNISMNVEARQVKYSGFSDAITLSGTSFGVGFTFEYL